MQAVPVPVQRSRTKKSVGASRQVRRHGTATLTQLASTEPVKKNLQGYSALRFAAGTVGGEVEGEISEHHHQQHSSLQFDDHAETEFMSGVQFQSPASSRHSSQRQKKPQYPHTFEKNKAMCREHAFCVPDPLEERIPIGVNVPLNLPWGIPADTMKYGTRTQNFLRKVEQGFFGETGPQKPGTKTIPTQYSLDHYLAQQWDLDIDNMPYTLPEDLSKVQKRFASYTRKGIQQVKLNPSAKPTLQKKFTEWEKAKLEQKQRQLELLFFRSNQDPKIYRLLQQFKDENPAIMSNGKRQKQQQRGGASKEKKQGKHSDPKYFYNDPQDMVPLVYADTIKVDPLLVQLQKEHDEITRMYNTNLGTSFAELAQRYYDKKEKKEKEDFKKKMFNQRSTVEQEKSNYHPSCLAVKKRMDSEHLNSWLVRSEIQYSAERFIQFQEMLAKASPEQLEQYRAMSNRAMSNRAQSNYHQTSAPTTMTKLQVQPNSLKSATGTPKFSQTQKAVSRYTQSNNQFVLMQSPTAQSVKECFDIQSASNQSGTQHRKTKSQARPMSTKASTAATRLRAASTGKNSSRQDQRVLRLFSSNKNLELGEYGDIKISTGMLMEQSHDEDMDNDKNLRSAANLTETRPLLKSDSKKNTQSQNSLGGRAGLSRAATQQMRKHKPGSSNPHFSAMNDYESQPATKGLSRIQSTPKKPASFKIIVSSASASKETATLRSDLKSESRQRRQSELQNHRKIALNEELGTPERSDNRSSYRFRGSALSSGRIPCRRRANVHGDLVEAQEGKGRLSQIFNQAKWQHDKDKLVNSMNHHMHKHRPRVHLTAEQEKKRLELAGRTIEGNQLLQKRLSHHYGMKGIPDVELPPECQLYLSEAPAILENKQRQDSQMRKSRDDRLNPCTRAVLTAKAFETLNRSSQQKELSRKQDQIRIESSSLGSIHEAKKFGEVPIDPKPDVLTMTQARFDHIKSAFVQKIAQDFSKGKPAWKLTEDDQAAGAVAEQNEDVNSNIQMPSHTMTASPSNSRTMGTRQASPKRVTSATRSNFFQTKTEQLTKDLSTHEAQSPGVGAPARGRLLKKFTNEILMALDVELTDTVYEKNLQQLMMPECEWDSQKLNSHIKDMTSSEFWQQKGLLCSKQGKDDAAMDYYRQGLRKNPTNEVLLYSLALCYLQLNKYQSALHWFSKGLNLNPRWIDGLCGCSIAYFNMKDYEKALKYITLAQENFKGFRQQKARLCLNTILFIQATCLKQTRSLDPACNMYQCLEEQFQSKRNKDLISLLWGCVLIPLASERRAMADHYRNMEELLEHIRPEPMPAMDGQNLLLSRFCKNALKDKHGYTVEKLVYQDYKEGSKVLNFDVYPKSIWTLLERKSFFKRFNKITNLDDKRLYGEILARADVELYKKDQPVLLDDRVGVVTMGSIEVRSHNIHNLLKPTVLNKATEGEILGSKLDTANNAMMSPLTWLISMQEQTEVVYLSQEDFKKLWIMQRKFTEQFLVINKLNQNKYFKVLNQTTKYHLVFECLELRKYHPAQLMLSVHKRSPLSPVFQELFQDGTSKFRKEIDNKIMKQMEKHSSVYQGYLNALNQPSSPVQYPTNSVDMNTVVTRAAPEQQTKQVDENTLQVRDQATEFLSENPGTLVSTIMSGRRSQIQQSTIEMRAKRLSTLRVLKIDDATSHSTDYGVEHCRQIMEEKAQQNPENYLTNFDSEQEEQARTEAEDVKEPQNEESKEEEFDHEFSDYATQHFQGIDSIIDKDETTFDERSRSRSPGKQRLNHTAAIEDVSISQFTKQSKFKRAPEQPSFESTPRGSQNAVGNRSKTFNRVHTMLGKRLSKLVHNRTALLEKKFTFKTPGIAHQQTQILDFTSHMEDLETQPISPKKTKAETLLPQVKVQYNFLFEKYIEKIEKNDRKTKRELKNRKQQLNYLLKFVTGLKQFVISEQVPADTAALELLFKRYSENFHAQKVTFEEDLIPSGSSGYWNSHLIDKMNAGIEKILLSIGQIENSQELFLKFLVSEIDSKYKKQVDPDGIHFIAAGDAFILGPDGTSNMKLHTNDCFGNSDYLRRPGPEFVGDVRAGLHPVQTFYFEFKHLKKQVSVQEKLRMYEVAGENDRMDGIIKFMVRRDNIDQEEKLRRY